jgi:hypothetical protein
VTAPRVEVVPFGKYRGQPLEALAQDRQYVEWLIAQPWFREKYGNVYNVVINNFGEPSETPEHNALQARFTDSKFCWAFVRCISDDLKDLRAEWLKLARTHIASLLEMTDRLLADREIAPAKHGRELADLRRWFANGDAERRERLAVEAYNRECTSRDSNILWNTVAAADYKAWIADGRFSVSTRCEYEVDGIDVVLFFTVKAKSSDGKRCIFDSFNGTPGLDYNDATSDRRIPARLPIELKPTVADEYPAILRQMRRSGASILLLGEYLGVGATLDQVRTMFAQSGLRMLFVRDVEAWMERPVQQWNDDVDA